MKNNNFPQPYFDKIIVDPFPAYQPKGGIIVPDTVTKITAEGVVVAVGEGYRNPDGSTTPLKTKVGDKVKWRSGSQTDLDYGEEKETYKLYFIIREADILCKMPASYKCNELPPDPSRN